MAGCWQEVEYTGGATSSSGGAPTAAVDNANADPHEADEELPLVGQSEPTATSEPPAAVATEASEFGSDLADSLATEESAPPLVQDAATGHPWENDASGDSYAAPSLTAADGSTTVDETPTATVVESPAASGDTTAIPEAPTLNPFTDTAQPAADNADIAESSTDAVAANRQPGESGEATSGLATEATEAAPVASEVTDSAAAGGAVDAPPTATPPSNVVNPRLDAWRLGSNLSLAALANDRGLAADNVQSGMSYCRQLAAGLGTSVAELPERGLATSSGRPASRQALNYLLFVEGQRVGRELASRHGAEHAALFEVATKSNLLLVLYVPGATAASAISDAISQAAPRAQLPAALWQPLLQLVAAQADAAEVRQAVRDFHAEVEAYLAQQTATP